MRTVGKGAPLPKTTFGNVMAPLLSRNRCRAVAKLDLFWTFHTIGVIPQGFLGSLETTTTRARIDTGIHPPQDFLWKKGARTDTHGIVDSHEGLGIPRGGTKETLFHCPQRGMLVQFEEPFDAPQTADGNVIVAGTRKSRDAYREHRVLVA
jgi:hypothetical protein